MYKVSGLGLGISGLGFRVCALGFGVQAFGFRVLGCSDLDSEKTLVVWDQSHAAQGPT